MAEHLRIAEVEMITHSVCISSASLLKTIYDIETSRDNIVIVVTNESKSF